MELVDSSAAFPSAGDELGFLENPQVLGDRGTAHGKLSRETSGLPRLAAQAIENSPPRRVRERLKNGFGSRALHQAPPAAQTLSSR